MLDQETHRRIAELETLTRISREIVSVPDLTQAFASIARYTVELSHTDAGGVFAFRPDGCLYLVAGYQVQDAFLQAVNAMGIPPGQGAIGRAAAERQPVQIPDVLAEPGYPFSPLADMEHIRAILAVPMLRDEAVIGGIVLWHRQPHAFRPEEVAFVQAIAQQCVNAVENTRLCEILRESEAEIRRRALEQSIVSQIARALNATLDVRQVFPTVVEGLRTLTECERVSLVLIDETGTEFTLVALGQPRPELGQGMCLPLTATSAGADVLAGRVHLTADLSRELDYPAERALYAAGFRARVNLPLVVGERIIGALNLASRRVGAFSTAQLPVLQQIASAVAIAIENTRLFEAEQVRRTELAALYDLSRALANANDYDTVLDLITRQAVKTVGVTFARVLLLEDGEWVVRAAYPVRVLDHDLDVGRRAAPESLPACGRVLWQDEPVVLHRTDPSLTELEREVIFLNLAQTLCLIPLRAGEHALGLLMLGEARSEEREPFTADKLRLARSIGDQAASALHRAQLFARLELSYYQTVLALAKAVDARDTYTSDHAQRLADMAVAIGRELGISPDELEDIRYGAILHDIGKIGIPDAILQKPARLDAHEWRHMRQHPVIGAQILAPVPRLAGAAQIVRHHHERYDGTGYPDGLAGEAIPLAARILTVVDAYSAITDARVYKPARSHEEAIAELKHHAGTQFDPAIVETFIRLFGNGQKPPFSHRTLSLGESLLVTGQIGPN